MALTDPSGSTPQFATAEYASGAESCKSCNQPISGSYYRVNGSLTCERCVEQLKNQIPKDNHAAFVRGLLFGLGGAAIGLILYSTFAIVTGIVIGYFALAVGWIVGKAVMKGSNGIGGRRYQVAALALTYAAVSMAAIPISIAMYMKGNSKQNPAPTAQQSTTPESTPGLSDAPSGSNAASQPPHGVSSPAEPKMTFGRAMFGLMLMGLAAPFLELQDPVHGLIGLVILSVGLRIAWQITGAAKIDILGPFGNRPPASTTPAA